MSFLLLLSIFLPLISASDLLYTAVSHMKEVFETEAALIETLRQYIESQKEQLTLLERYHRMFQEQHEIGAVDVQNYVENPIGAFSLIKRLTVDWPEVETLVENNSLKEFTEKISHFKENLKFPSSEDLEGVAKAFVTLQKTYLLNATSLANGEINGVKYKPKMNAEDCFELGKQLYNRGIYRHAELWLREAANRLDDHEVVKTVERHQIMLYLAFSLYKQGDISSALDVTSQILEIFKVHHGKGLKNENNLEAAITISHELMNQRVEEDPQQIMNETDLSYLRYWLDVYERICRKEISLSIEVTSKLKCYYTDNDKPFLRIAPFKVEEAHVEPQILIFHDVIYDSEIEELKKLAYPKLRGALYADYNGKPKTGDSRVNKAYFLNQHDDKEHKFVRDLNERVTDITSLTVETDKIFQVANYGIGGQYVCHFDFHTRKEAKELQDGNRIATLLFYMSDVTLGGATVFPKLNVTVLPQKGTAVLWYNLHRNGDLDFNSMHGSCPVLVGSKWIINKWFRERGQEFTRPCSLRNV